MEEKKGQNFRLFKWSLAVQRSHDSLWETYSVQEIVSAQLLAMIEDQATFKFLAYSGNLEESKDALLVSKLPLCYSLRRWADYGSSSGSSPQT